MESAISSRTRWLTFIFVALLGLAVRLPQLGVRPMHSDEAINGYIVGQLLSGEPFRYDPQDRHGPALSALALPLARIQGARTFSDLTESELRLTSVIAGTFTILLFGTAVEMFELVPCLAAALLFAFAPLSVYYDRYFIHESLFCAATFGFILSSWRAAVSRSLETALVAAACAAIMLASKETALLHFFALTAAGLLFGLSNRSAKPFGTWVRPRTLCIAGGTFFALSVLLYTWFGRNWKALPVLWLAIPDTFSRAAGQGHAKPFWYFAQFLTSGRSGWLLIALASLGLIATTRRRDRSAYSYLGIYFFFIAAIYSFIPYKTPWLALNLWLPIAVFAGRGIEVLWKTAAKHLSFLFAVPIFVLLAAVIAALIGYDTRQRVFLHAAEEQNPYAYAHTTEDILELPTEISEMAKRDGIPSPRIAVIASDPWPLPWYLRHINQVGFWQPGQQPGEADFYITSTEAAEQYRDRLQGYRADFFGVRPGVLILLWLPTPK